MFPSSVTLKLVSFFEQQYKFYRMHMSDYGRLLIFFFFSHFYLNRISTLRSKISVCPGQDGQKHVKTVTNNIKEQLKTIKYPYNI